MEEKLLLISVVTPSYNQAQFLEETILSVLNQDYPYLEYIIIDGGSSDGSVDIVRKYEERLAYWVSEPDRGQSHALNKGIGRATGDILFWLNADDICLPGAFSKVAEAFSQQPPPRIVIGQAYIIDHEGKLLGQRESQFTSWADYATRKCDIRQVAAFFDRKLFNELGGVDESLEYAMDTDLLLRFTRLHYPLIINEYLAAYRKHGGTKFKSNLLPGYREADMIRIRHLDGPELENAYRDWSARHWFLLAISFDTRNSDRLPCLRNVWCMKPSVFFSIHFWLVPVRLLLRWLISKFRA
jgi:glycosyltransferase involved in cell wall biosynthesis